MAKSDITVTPTFQLYKNGELVSELEGVKDATPKAVIAMIDNQLKADALESWVSSWFDNLISYEVVLLCNLDLILPRRVLISIGVILSHVDSSLGRSIQRDV